MRRKKVIVAWTKEYEIDVADDASISDIEEMAIKNATFSFTGDDPIVVDIVDVEQNEENKND